MTLIPNKLIDIALDAGKRKMREIAEKLDLNANGVRDIDEVVSYLDDVAEGIKLSLSAGTKLAGLIALYYETYGHQSKGVKP